MRRKLLISLMLLSFALILSLSACATSVTAAAKSSAIESIQSDKLTAQEPDSTTQDTFTEPVVFSDYVAPQGKTMSPASSSFSPAFTVLDDGFIFLDDMPSNTGRAVLVDDGGIKVVAMSIDQSGPYTYGPAMHLLIENDSGKDLSFHCENTYVNGYYQEPMFETNVPNNTSAMGIMTFFSTALKDFGIERIDNISSAFCILDMNTSEVVMWTPQFDVQVVETSNE